MVALGGQRGMAKGAPRVLTEEWDSGTLTTWGTPESLCPLSPRPVLCPVSPPEPASPFTGPSRSRPVSC